MHVDVTDIGEVKSYLVGSGYPAELTDMNVSRAMDDALRNIKTKAPLVIDAAFTTVASQTIYDLFNYSKSDPAPLELLDPLGLRVIELDWQDGFYYGCDPLFFQGPGLGPYNGKSYFPFELGVVRESDALIYEQSLASRREHFGRGYWRHTSTDVSSPIVLDPTPREAKNVYLRYAAARADSVYQSEFHTPYLTMIEAAACRIAARLARTTAGIKFALLDDSGKRSSYWAAEAILLDKRADQQVDDILTGVISPATRG